MDGALNRWKGWFWIHLAAGSFALMATILMFEARDYRYRASELKTGAISATGTVASANTAKDRTWTVRYVYTDAVGNRHEGTQGSLAGSGWRTGDRVHVRYSRRDPVISAIVPERLEAHAQANTRIAWMCIVIALVAGGFQLRHYWRAYRRSRQS